MTESSTATYTNIYVQPFLKISQRKKWDEFINNDLIFFSELIYLPDDQNFGVQTSIKMVLEFGIQELNLADYVPALYFNFYRRRLTFGDVKVAIARDVDGTHIYDAVYVDIVDDIEGAKSVISMNGNIYYPGSIDNIRNSLTSIRLSDNSVISVDNQQLPRFMTNSSRIDPSKYIKVVTLCYALPGQGNKIASRIRGSKFDFKLLDFEIDRLVVETSLDNSTAKYLMFPRTSITDQVS